MLKDHQDKLQRVEEKTILERLERCQKIVDGSRRMPLQKPLIFRMPDASVFESPCTGIYESCQGEEVSSFDLQQLSLSKTEVNPGKRSSSAVNSCAAPAASSSWPGPEMSTHSKEESKNSDSNWVGFRTALEQKALDDMKVVLYPKNSEHVSRTIFILRKIISKLLEERWAAMHPRK